jgi:DNA helicase HerA-like ATPase
MPALSLFPPDKIVGVFRGFREGGLEFHADLVLPYRNEFQNLPMHGHFLLVQLETPDEAVLGRIASFSSDGKLASPTGEEFNIRAIREGRVVPEDLREQYLKYRVNIRVLGVIRSLPSGELTFIASHRRLPHVGSAVAFPGDEVLQEIAGHNVSGAELGHLAMGEYVYASGSSEIELLPWMQMKSPEVLVRFPIENLVSRRSFIFARAGFGKSNLTKLLFSTLYKTTPTVTKRGERQVPVGTVIFDPDGEYFWPDDKGRPGLCDVPELDDKLVVFTSRNAPSALYGSFVAGRVKLDIRQLPPSDVISIALPLDRQEQQNVRKLRGLNQDGWKSLVDLIDHHGNSAPLDEVSKILSLDRDQQQVEALAARSNMTSIVRMLHDKSSQLMDMLLHALSQGKLCIVDVSQLRGTQALVLSGLVLRRIFNRNQEEFTAAQPRTIPTIAVVEEAQTVLNERATAAEPYITWVKEGRKYDLGAVLVTQQPGSIPSELLSQGDNWFIFHLLSASDLGNVQRANAHFSDDLLSSLLNEPIPGQGVFWSSAGGRPYPVAVRALSFELLTQTRDPGYNLPAIRTFADELATEFEQRLQLAAHQSASAALVSGNGKSDDFGSESSQLMMLDFDEGQDTVDVLQTLESAAIEALRRDERIMSQLRGDGVAWGTLKAFLKEQLPETMDNRDQRAYELVRTALEHICGPQNVGWHSDRRQARSSDRQVMYVKVGPRAS